MGYFLALDIPDSALSGLNEFSLPQDEAIRKQRREDLHITLAYIGHVPDDKLEGLEAALAEIEISAFSIQGQGAAYFGPGPGYRNHFFTAEIQLDAALQNLKEQIDAACLDQGLKPRRHDQNSFHPHITLARADIELDQKQIDKFIKDNKDKKTPPFQADHFSLYKSQPPKPYLKIRDFPLN